MIKIRKKSILFFILITIILYLISVITVTGKENAEKVKLIFFYKTGCSYCKAEKAFLGEIKVRYPELVIEEYEVSQDSQNLEFMKSMCEEHGFAPPGVPVTFIDHEYILGFRDEATTGKFIEDVICKCLGLKNETEPLCFPFVGCINPREVSLPVLTVSLGFLDGFNPCSMWVLSFLLTLLIYTRSRRNILLVGFIFVITSAVIYFLFMTAWLNFFILVGYTDILRFLVGGIAIIAGLINVKDFFYFGKGISLTIPESSKPDLYRRIRKLIQEGKKGALLAMISGTIVLAVSVNFVELLCTAGFPAVYTRILTLHNLSFLTYYSYIALYCIFYIIPLLFIVSIFTITFRRRKLSNREGRMLKFIGGVLMLLLGIILILKPELLMFGV